MANLEISLEQEVGNIVKTPFPGLFNGCSIYILVEDVIHVQFEGLILSLHTYH